MEILAGTSGYSYKEWQGYFYPEKIAPKDMLSFYGTRLPAVEINNTFYRLPKISVLETWAENVPESFRFSIKASRRITHMRRLKNAESETEYLLKNLTVLGERLGVVLFQLPPYVHADPDRLRNFLKLIPPELNATFEFRHKSWREPAALECLREKNAALCLSDEENGKDSEEVSTADWGYVRLRQPEYSDKDLTSKLKSYADLGWKKVYVFFKHEDEGAAANMAQRLLDLKP